MAAHVCIPCHACADFVCPDDRPSPIFTTFSVLLNGGLAIWHIVGLASATNCSSDASLWTGLAIMTAGVNIIFAFYLYFRFWHKIRQGGDTVAGAACTIFLYDWGVALYLLFLIWHIVWLVLAGQARARTDEDADDCANLLEGGIIIFIIYLVLGGFVVALSLCTECCRTPRWKAEPQPVYAASPAPVVHQHVGPADPYNHHGHHQQQQYEQRPGLVGRAVDTLFGPKRSHDQHGHHGGPPASNPHFAA